MEVSDNSGDLPAEEFPELLQFCARAEAMIAELQLLSDRVPSRFVDPRFDPVLFDLRYFESPREFEAKINANIELQTLEDELNASCSNFTKRFFILSNGIIQYHIDLNKYLTDLQEGVYLDYSLEGILESKNGQKILTESIYLFGCILLLIEHLMHGPLREKILILYFRINQSFNLPNLDKICSLCQTNNNSSLTNKPNSNLINIQTTEDLFAKFPLPKQIIDDIIISCLKGDDISIKGGCLYVLLNYSNGFLHNGPFMKKIIEGFFENNWVLPVFLHFLVDLFISWDNYKEAKDALIAYLSPVFIKKQCIYHCTKVKDLISELDFKLSKGVLNKEYMLQNSQNTLSFVKNYNLTLRWLLLHRMSIDKKARDTITSVCLLYNVDNEILLQFILKASKFEFEVKRLYSEILANKEDIWRENKQFISEYMVNLSQNQVLSSKFKNKGLNEWFENLSSEVKLLDYTKIGISNRAINRIISLLKEIEKLHQIQENTQIKNVIIKTQEKMQDLIKIISLNKDFIENFSMICDTGYGWGFLSQIEKNIQNNIKKDAANLQLLPSFFLKFQSELNAPFLCVQQIKSQDLLCISNYYSSKYSAKIFAFLDIIPVILLETNYNEDILNAMVLKSNRINKETFEDFFQVDLQLKLAHEAANLCLISEGILVISQTFNDIIQLNLKDWLEKKLRILLLKQIEKKLQSFILSSGDLERSLNLLLKYVSMQSQKLNFLQDIFGIHGTHIWNESLNSFLEQCALTEEIEINISNPKSFLGLLLQKIIILTDPSRSMFIEPMLGWFDAEGNEILGLYLFTLLESCIGKIGLASLSSILTKLIRTNLENTLKSINTLLDSKFSEELCKLNEQLGTPVSIPLIGLSLYNHIIKIYGTSWKPLIDDLANIGQMQLLLSLINFRLKSNSKCKAGILNASIEAFIDKISHESEKIIKENEENSTRNIFLNALNQKRKIFGLICPLNSIYISKNAPIFLSRFIALLSISQLPRYVLDIHLGTLTSRSKTTLKDFSPLIIGIVTLMRQFHPMNTTQYIQFMSQYICALESSFVSIDESNKAKVPEAVFWLRSFCKYAQISEDIINSNLALLNVLQS